MMSIFQKSVINKHLKNLDSGQVKKAYQKFRANYNSSKIEEIKKLKEEQYQDGFLRDIFVDVFGYVLAPDENHNLIREFKNIADSKKADGAILKDGKAVAVIELKSTKTKDLKSVTEQAFGYKHNQPDCKYVIISNFQKLQFYIDYANEYEEFDLFHLQKDEFELLYLLLNSESIFSDLPLKLKTETKFHEEDISDKLYKDYSIFKRKLFENLIKNNPEQDKLTLFKKSQKLLDRFLFILFAEDSGLLPPNSITRVIDTFNKLEELDAYKPIYEIYKQYFGYMNIGRKGKTETDKITAYNGGLFYPDDLLDSLIIDDEILIADLLKLSEYDFNTEVDVNILGHIFEHSLNEIEEITAEIAATAATRGHVPLGKGTSKRKKDGVFYTPKYITQYIVENTVGTLCKEKRKEFGISEIEFDGTFKTKDGKLSVKEKKLFETLEKYKEWLLTLKIVDPACGSGAFLNQALNFLIAEHKSIDDIIAELTNTPLRLFDTEKSILENNLYGVDINEESVEIAKLSLWLRTARKDRKLSNLNSNIKCGNSLIDDPEVAGEKAFNWHKEFPQIFTEKKKEVWHITTATHNSRYSQRMFDYHVKKGEAISISEEDAIIITKAIADIVKESKNANNGICPIDILEYNICDDHLHLLLVCEKEEVPKIVGKLKGVSAKKYNIAKGITIPSASGAENGSEEENVGVAATRGRVPLSGQVPSSDGTTISTEIDSLPTDEENISSPKKKKYNSLWTQKFGNSRIKDEEYLRNAMTYIRNNREKHGLPENKKLRKIIDKMICTTEQAFRTEYKGGFDVVIGNSPYVSISSLPKYIHHYFEKFYTEIHTGYNDLMSYFLYLGINILNASGKLGVITSNYFIGNDYAKNLRVFLSAHLVKIVNFENYHVFKDANVHTAIVLANYKPKMNIVQFETYEKGDGFGELSAIKLDFSSSIIKRRDLGETWIIADEVNKKIFDKLTQKNIQLGKISEIAKGSESGKNDIFTITKEIIETYNIEEEILKKCIKNSNISSYYISYDNLYLIYTDNLFTKEKYPRAYNFLMENKETLLDRRGPKTGEYDWWRLHRPSLKHIFDSKEKILVPYRANSNKFGYDNQKYFNNGRDVRAILITDKRFSTKYIVTILNSSLINWHYGFIGKPKGNSREYFNKPLSLIPIVEISLFEQNNYVEKADKMLELNKQLQQKKTKFLNRVKDNFAATATSRGHVPLAVPLTIMKKLNSFYNFDFKTFIAELKKQKVKISLTEQDEWEEFFNNYKTEINNLQSEIDKTDKEIDQMVYELYGLTEEEIGIVEESIN